MANVRYSRAANTDHSPTRSRGLSQHNTTSRPSFFQRITWLIGGRSTSHKPEDDKPLLPQHAEQRATRLTARPDTALDLPEDISIPTLQNLTSTHIESSYCSFPAYQGPGSRNSSTIMSGLFSGNAPTALPGKHPRTADESSSFSKRLSWTFRGHSPASEVFPSRQMSRSGSQSSFKTQPSVLVTHSTLLRPPTRGSNISRKVDDGPPVAPTTTMYSTNEVYNKEPSIAPESEDTISRSHPPAAEHPNLGQKVPCRHISSLEPALTAVNASASPRRLFTSAGEENIPHDRRFSTAITQLKRFPSAASSQKLSGRSAVSKSAALQSQITPVDARPTPQPDTSRRTSSQTPPKRRPISYPPPKERQSLVPSRPISPRDWSLTTTNSFLRDRGVVPYSIAEIQSSSGSEQQSSTDTDYHAGSSGSSSETVVGRFTEERWFTEGRAWASRVSPVREGYTSVSESDSGVRPVGLHEGRGQRRSICHREDQNEGDSRLETSNITSNLPLPQLHMPPRTSSRTNNRTNEVGRNTAINNERFQQTSTTTRRSSNTPHLRGGAGSVSSDEIDGNEPGRERPPPRGVDPDRRVPRHLWFFAGGRGSPPTVETYRKKYGKSTGRKGDPGKLGKAFGVGDWGVEEHHEREREAARAEAGEKGGLISWLFGKKKGKKKSKYADIRGMPGERAENDEAAP